MLRLILFLGTNFAIVLLISLTFRLLGLDGLLQQNGVDLDINALIMYSAIIGFAGSLISLFLSKSIAKATMRVQVIGEPRKVDRADTILNISSGMLGINSVVIIKRID